MPSCIRFGGSSPPLDARVGLAAFIESRSVFPLFRMYRRASPSSHMVIISVSLADSPVGSLGQQRRTDKMLAKDIHKLASRLQNVTFRHRPSKTNHGHQEENLQVAVAWSLTFVRWNHPQTWQGSVHPPTCPCNLGFLRRLAAQPANGHSVRPWANAPEFSLASTPFCIQNSAP